MALQSVNTALVSSLGQAGVKSVGISGVDGGLFVGDLGNGQLGRVASSLDVSPGFLQELWSIGAIPVLAPIARDRDGLLLNCNADVAAGALAAALGAQAVVLLSDVGQLRRVAEDEASGLDIVTKAEVDVMLANGAIRDGMRPKVRAALEALDAGAEQVIISNGKISHALSQALEGVSLTTKVVQ
jgi:acetylglutamate kinase